MTARKRRRAAAGGRLERERGRPASAEVDRLFGESRKLARQTGLKKADVKKAISDSAPAVQSTPGRSRSWLRKCSMAARGLRDQEAEVWI